MKKIISLVWLQLIQIIHSRSELVGIFLLPLLFTVIFGVVFGSNSSEPKVPVVIVDNDGSIYSKQVRELLKKEDAYTLKTVSQATAEDQLSKKEITAAVIINKDFGKDLENGKSTDVEILKMPNSTRAMAVVESATGIIGRVATNVKSARINSQILNQSRQDFLEKPLPVPVNKSGIKQNQALQPVPVKNLPEPVLTELAKTFPYLNNNPKFNELYKLADDKWEPTPPVSIKVDQVTASKVRGDSTLAMGFSQSSIGFTLMFVMFIVFGGAQGILEEREQGTLQRLLTAPITKVQLMLGEICALFIRGVMQAIILILFGALLFNVPWGDDPLPVIIIVSTFVLAITGLAILFTAVSRTRGQMIALTNVIVISLAMLGGSFWPIEITPAFMQTISKFTPTGWAASGLVDIVVRHQGISEAFMPALILLGFAAISFVVGLKFLKFE